MMQFILPAVMSMAGSMMTNAMNRQNVSDTNSLNEKLQREQWARDDTAYSRTVQDMQNAGLNPLQGVNPQSSPLSASMSSFQAENPLASLEQLPQVFMAQKQFDLQNKSLAVQAVKAGIDPKQLNNFTDKDLLKWYKQLIQFQAQEAGKAAGSRNNRNSGIVGKAVGDVRDSLPDGVNDVIDSALEVAGDFGKSIKDVKKNGKRLVNDVKSVATSDSQPKTRAGKIIQKIKQGYNKLKGKFKK